MKVLHGSLKESLYSWPDPQQSKPPTLRKETVYPVDGTTYMSDQLGLHKISNASEEEVAVSLHREWMGWVGIGSRRVMPPRPSAIFCSNMRAVHPPPHRIPSIQSTHLPTQNTSVARSSTQRLVGLAK